MGGAAPYSSLLTCSPHVTGLPFSSTCCIAMWVMKRLGAAPCQWSSPGSKNTRSAGRLRRCGDGVDVDCAGEPLARAGSSFESVSGDLHGASSEDRPSRRYDLYAAGPMSINVRSP